MRAARRVAEPASAPSAGLAARGREQASLPGPLLARYAGDWRSLLPGISAGILQLAHPAIGAGLADHSRFFEENTARIVRSIPQIWGTILDSPAEVGARARDVRDAHRDIKGLDHHGGSYHALHPDVYWWAHATFTWEIFRSIELFHHRVPSDRELEALYADTVRWYALYGMTSRPLPPDYGSFRAEFDRICGEVLQLTPTARALGVGRRYRPRVKAHLLDPARAASNAVERQLAQLGAGCLPEGVRDRLGIPWTRADRLGFAAFSTAVRNGFRFVPASVNRSSVTHAIRMVGARTRDQRLRPPARSYAQ